MRCFEPACATRCCPGGRQPPHWDGGPAILRKLRGVIALRHGRPRLAGPTVHIFLVTREPAIRSSSNQILNFSVSESEGAASKRSEERRVGKECRSRGATCGEKKSKKDTDGVG